MIGLLSLGVKTAVVLTNPRVLGYVVTHIVSRVATRFVANDRVCVCHHKPFTRPGW